MASSSNERSTALDQAPAATIYIPFSDAVFWFLTSTLSPATTPIASMVCVPLSVMFAVVATRQGSL